MQLPKTIILKLDILDDAIRELLSIYSQGMNHASQIVFDNGKPISSGAIQRATYRYLRNELGLKSQMSCNVARQIAGAYKALREQIAIGQAEWQLLKFSPTFATFSFNETSVLAEIL